MRAGHLSVLLVAFLAATVQTAAQESVREIRVLSPGVVYNAGFESSPAIRI
jgi:hypothetical protein